MPKCNEKEFYFKTLVEAEGTCKRQRTTIGSAFLSLERQDQIFRASQRPQEMEGTEEKPRESNKGQHRLNE